MRWGMVGYEEEEQDRPQFEGEPIKSAVNGRPALYFSKIERTRRNILSNLAISVLVLIVIGVIAVIFTIRIAIQQTGFAIAGVEMASIIASILIALQIQILNFYFGEIALKLNNNENHRTGESYRRSPPIVTLRLPPC